MKKEKTISNFKRAAGTAAVAALALSSYFGTDTTRAGNSSANPIMAEAADDTVCSPVAEDSVVPESDSIICDGNNIDRRIGVVDISDDTVTLSDYKAVKAFLDLDFNVLDILSKDAREYMILYLEADSVLEAPNEFNGFSRLERVSDKDLKVKLTNVSNLDIKILETDKKENIVMTIYTIGDSNEAPDSEVAFFSYPDHTRLKTEKYLKLPELKDFFEIPKGSMTKMKEIEEMVPFPTIVFSTTPNSNTLTARLSIEKFVNQDDYNIIRLFLKDNLTYEWDGKKFKRK